MAKDPSKFDVKSTASWTVDSIQRYFKQGDTAKSFFLSFYNWNDEEFTAAYQFVRDFVYKLPIARKKELLSGRLSHLGSVAVMRGRLQLDMLSKKPALFQDRYDGDQKPWFVPMTVNGQAKPDEVDTHCVPQQFIAHAIGKIKKEESKYNKRTLDMDSDENLESSKKLRTGHSIGRRSSEASQSSAGMTNELDKLELNTMRLKTTTSSKPAFDSMIVYIVHVTRTADDELKLDRNTTFHIRDIMPNDTLDWQTWCEILKEEGPDGVLPSVLYRFDAENSIDDQAAIAKVKNTNKLFITSALRKLYEDAPNEPTTKGLQLFLPENDAKELLDDLPWTEAFKTSKLLSEVTVKTRTDPQSLSAANIARAQRDAKEKAQREREIEQAQRDEETAQIQRDEEHAQAQRDEEDAQAQRAQEERDIQEARYQSELELKDREEQDLRKAVSRSLHPDVAMIPDSEGFPHMVRRAFDFNMGPKLPPPLIKPSVEVYGEWSKVEEISTGTTTRTRIDLSKEEDDPVDVDEYVRRTLETNQHSEDLWLACCDFFGFDKEDDSPKSGAWFPGWSPHHPLLVYQLYTIAFVLRKLLTGSRFVIIGHEMGLGKTAIAVGTLMTLEILADLGSGPGRKLLDPSEPNEYYFDGERIAGGAIEEVHKGPKLIVCPGKVIPGFVDNIRKFGGKDRKIVIAWSEVTNSVRNREYPGCLLPEEEIPVKFRPSASQIHGAWTDGMLPSPLNARAVLEPRAGGDPEDWQSDWWVLTTPESLHKQILLKDPSTGKAPEDQKKSTRNLIDATWSFVVVDEIHEAKSYNAGLWPHIAALPGNPGKIYMSGTYVEKIGQLIGPFMAAESHNFKATGPVSAKFANGPTEAKPLHKAWENIKSKNPHKQYEFHLRSDSDLVTGIRLLQFGFRKIAQLSSEIDNKMAKVASLSNSVENGAAVIPEEVKSSLQEVTKVFQEMVIEFKADFVWKPRPGSHGYPAVDKPPHSIFDIGVNIPSEYQADLEPLWQEMKASTSTRVAKSAGNKAFSFVSAVRPLRIHTTFPCLPTLMKSDAALKDELGNLDTTDAAALVKDGKQSVLWGHMKTLDTLPSMVALKTIIRNIRKQKKDGGPRKVVVVAFLPMSIALIYLYLQWLALDDPSQGFELDDLVFTPTSISTSARNDQIKRFRSTTGDAVKERPGILVAAFAAVRNGVELVPADCMILLDPEWGVDKINQLFGRVSRTTIVQKSLFTEGFRVVSSSPWCELQRWMVDRQDIVLQLQKSVKGSKDV